MAEESIREQVIRGASALAAARLLSRVIGLIRTLTIARWLGPAEMGVFAVATVVMSALEIFAETGMRPALIQKQGDLSPYLLPVRTLNAVRGIIIGILIFLIAPVISLFFHSPDSISIVRTIAILPVINGFEPLYIILAQRSLEFHRVVKLQLAGAIVGLVVGVVYAHFRPDAWSMVWATLASAAVITTGAHILARGRDLGFNFNWKSLKDLRHFGVWIAVNRQVGFIYRKGGDWFIGRLLEVTQLAYYQMAMMVSQTLIVELGAVIGQLGFPVFSKIANDKKRLIRAYQEAFGLLSVVTLLMAAIFIISADEIVYIFLGEKWQNILPLIPWLTISAVCTLFNQPQGALLRALGKVKIATVFLTLNAVIWAAAIYPITKWKGTVGIAFLSMSIGLLTQFVCYYVIAKLLDYSFVKIMKHVLLPAVAFAIVAIFGSWLKQILQISQHIPRLIILVLFAIITYSLVLWLCRRWLEPSPDILISRIKSVFKGDTKSKKVIREL